MFLNAIKPANRCSSAFIYILGRYKTQEMCDSVGSENTYLIVHCPGKYKTQGMYDEAVDNCLAALIGLLQVKCLKN